MRLTISKYKKMSGIDEKFSEEENTLYLVCDGYPVHHNEIARLAASDLNIKLILIPKGATDECQPLDRRIFGGLFRVFHKTLIYLERNLQIFLISLQTFHKF